MSLFEFDSPGDRDPDRANPHVGWLAVAGVVACVLAWRLVPGGPMMLFFLAAIIIGLITLLATRGVRQVDPTDEPPIDDAATRRPAEVDTGMSGEGRWTAARIRHDELMREWLPYETDPSLAFSYPALTDIREPLTARFFDAMHDAQVLRTDAYPGADRAAEYAEVVRTLARAWESARRHAVRKGMSGLDERDRKALQHVIKLLRHADEAATAEERATYAAQAHRLLQRLVDSGALVVPTPLAGAIESAYRKSLGDDASA